MRVFITFWKKDIVNKIIVLTVFLLILGFGVITNMVVNMPKNSLFYSYLAQSNTSTGMTSVSGTLLPDIVPTTISPTLTPLPPTITPTKLIFVTETSTPAPTQLSELNYADITSCIPNNPRTLARAVEIIDGNTIRAYFNEKVYIVRYIGIDVPGDENEYGQTSFWKNSEMVYAKDIVLVPGVVDVDERGRLLRYVLVGDTFVNYELIRQGLATPLENPSELDCVEIFHYAEKWANEGRAGIWNNTSTP